MADSKERNLQECQTDGFSDDSGMVESMLSGGQSTLTREATEDGEDVDKTWSVPSPQMSNRGMKRLDFETDGTQDNCQDEGVEEGSEPPGKRRRYNSTHELEIIDEIECDDDGPDFDLNDEGDFSEDDDLFDDEIYKWLDEDLHKKTKETAGGEQDDEDAGCPVEKEKVVLKERGNDPFDILPEGWVVVTHNSGMPVYLQKEHRVCSLARPYFLGPGSVRKHDIPLSAIPCLQYRKELVREGKLPDGTAKSGSADAALVSTAENGSPADEELAESHDPSTGQQRLQCPLNSSSSNSHIPKSFPSTDSSGRRSESMEREGCDSMGVEADLADDDASLVSGDSTLAGTGQVSETPLRMVNGTGSSQSSLADNSGANGSDASKLDGVEVNGVSDVVSIEGGGEGQTPQVKIESAEERRKETSLDPLEVRRYCEMLFEFKTITVRKYKTWRDRRRHMMMMKKQSRPELPSSTKLITCPLPSSTKPGEYKLNKRKEFVLNPSGKSSVCILHEYVQHTMRVQPKYIFKELENAQTPYSATVVINDVEYGTGYASSKKAAKLEAAKATLQILIPEMNKVTDEQMKDSVEDLSFFDVIKIEDPRIYELGNKAGQPSPYQILGECLRRNHGLGDTHCHMEMKQLKHQKSEFTMTVGKHTATVVAKNKRDGKQRAAQAILQLLHPHILCWGSLLRLYGNASMKKLSEKKDDMNINELQSKVKSSRPNNAILDKLRADMKKLHAEKASITSKGKLRVETTDLPKKISNLDL